MGIKERYAAQVVMIIIELFGRDFVYADTDSIKYSAAVSVKYSAAVKEYNEGNKKDGLQTLTRTAATPHHRPTAPALLKG